MRDFGCTQSPQSAFLLGLGLESLHVRMKRHCENAMAIAKFLKSHPMVSWVKYPNLEGDADYELACKYLPDGSCGVVSFGVKGGRSAAEKFMKALKLIAIETHVADARSCCLHPANATHRQMNEKELIAAGVPGDLIRLSCGIEHYKDLIADIEQALAMID
jgi:O-acetylhomoserine (thiol)-lyase